MNKVAMFVTNPCTHDARVIKEAMSLVKAGYSVRVYALGTLNNDSGLTTSPYGFEIYTIVFDFLENIKKMFNRAPDANKSQVLRHGGQRKNAFLIRIKKKISSIFLIVYKTILYKLFCRKAAFMSFDWGAEILHCHDLSTMPIVSYARKDSVKIVYDSHELWVHRNRGDRNPSYEIFWDRFKEARLIKYADRVITVSPGIVDWLVREYQLKTEPTLLRNMSVISESVYDKDLKERLGLSNSDFLIVYTGKITNGRGIIRLIKAISNIEKKYFAILGYGDDSYKQRILNISLELECSDRIIFCDPVDQSLVSNYIRGADMALVYIEAVCLSYKFALPNKLFEAIQAQVPVLASDLPYISSIVHQYNIGVCFQSDDELCQHIKDTNDVDLLQWEKNLEKLCKQFCWEIESNKLIALYETL